MHTVWGKWQDMSGSALFSLAICTESQFTLPELGTCPEYVRSIQVPLCYRIKTRTSTLPLTHLDKDNNSWEATRMSFYSMSMHEINAEQLCVTSSISEYLNIADKHYTCAVTQQHTWQNSSHITANQTCNQKHIPTYRTNAHTHNPPSWQVMVLI